MAFYNPYGYGMPYGAVQQYTQTAPAQVQDDGFIDVPDEPYARNYPTAPGASVRMKSNNGEFIYIKTAGFTQFDAPRFAKYRRVEEGSAPQAPNGGGDYAFRSELAAVAQRMTELEAELSALRQGGAKVE